ncbi:ABC transporter ATP-binding protein [Coprococcus sp. AF21-14LB]|uniref:ABC transporter ATP-binding protein n=1 Tax=Coprococcus sp. AF21-14LB TaxID=2292231 RepID=UPI000E51F531|nr:ABC transporter ATP-binding protein [Coprococcus sp. AF21-14LB]RGS77117.1 ABC transporter ATP-binding protein [Coprococcus sp. AF21-14LB]
MKDLKRVLYKIIIQNKLNCVYAIGLVLVFSSMQLYLPILLQQYIDSSAKSLELSVLMSIVVLYLGISGGICFLGILKDWNVSKIAWKGTDKLRVEIVDKILSYDEKFFHRNTPAQVIESLENDLAALEYFIENTLIPAFMNCIYMIGVLIVFWKVNIWAAILFFMFLGAALYIIYVQQKKDSDIILRERKSHSDISGFESEIIKNRKVVVMAGKEYPVLKRLENKMEQRIPLKIELQNYYYRVWIITLSLLAGVNIITLFIGGVLYFENIISLGVVYLMYSYGNMLKQPFEELQMHIQNFLAAKGSCEKLSEILFYQNLVTDGERSSVGAFEELELEDVSFAYGTDSILKHVSMKLPKGNIIGVFGESGAGKSTVSKLISKMLEPQEGKVLINGIDIRDYSIQAIRNTMAYVSAGNLILPSDFRDNLRLYNPHITDDEILFVLETKNLLKYFSFVKGKSGKEILDMPLTKDMFSNGEAQLLNLCRLFFVQKQIIIFDEASAMVDEKIEERFNEILRQLTQDVTTMIITHNVERLRECDYIYMMGDGEIVEEGKVSDLESMECSLFNKYAQRSWRE